MGYICQGCSTEQVSWTGFCPSCGSNRVLQVGTKDPLIGRVIAGKYRVLRKLGEGGMGAVYEGELEGIGQRVALKFLHQNFQMESKGALRFLNEAKGLARLSHPNTVSLHDFGQDEEGHFYISMEFVEGVDLRAFLEERTRLPPAEAIEIILQAADALGDAHGKGLIHRDIKPENIMVRRRARGLFVKVLDFGLARMMEAGSSRLTNAGTLMGSLRYMSPEQASGREVDARTDIYSLAIVLFELLSGVLPFTALNELDLLTKHKEAPMPHLWDVGSGLAFAELDAVIQRATAKDPAARFGSMEEFSIALGYALKRSAPAEPATLLDMPAAEPEPAAGPKPAVGPKVVEPKPGSPVRPVAAGQAGASLARARSSSPAPQTTALSDESFEPTATAQVARAGSRLWLFAAIGACLLALGLLWALTRHGRATSEPQANQPGLDSPASAPAPLPPTALVPLPPPPAAVEPPAALAVSPPPTHPEATLDAGPAPVQTLPDHRRTHPEATRHHHLGPPSPNGIVTPEELRP